MNKEHTWTMILLKHGTMENAERALKLLTSDSWTDDERHFMCEFMIDRDFKAAGLTAKEDEVNEG